MWHAGQTLGAELVHRMGETAADAGNTRAWTLPSSTFAPTAMVKAADAVRSAVVSLILTVVLGAANEARV